MDLLKRLDPLWIALLIVAGLNWAIITMFDTNVVTEIVGSGTGADIVYVLFGFAALMLVPRMLDAMHLTHHTARPHGA
ncbi:MAG: DUF378 domain-containing protein [Actinomycetota bacterium]|nr:DUF378 domain-containing protein [Actinomycetota bacterium]